MGMVRLRPQISPLDAAREGNRDAVIPLVWQENLAYVEQLATLYPQARLFLKFALCGLLQPFPKLQPTTGDTPLHRSRIGIIMWN